MQLFPTDDDAPWHKIGTSVWRFKVAIPPEVPSAIDVSGDLIAPGIIEMHTDNMEKHFVPRPGVFWPNGLAAALAQTTAALAAGRDTVVYTSRQLITSSDAAASLAIGRRVSEALVLLIRNLTIAPRYLIAKGGITSSDTATLGLGVRRALVLGQALPGVPVWQLGPEAKFPGLGYVVFPGNVGSDTALAELITRLHRS
jgi:hypothetical protein